MHRKRVEWILVKEAFFQKVKAMIPHFDSSFCDKFKNVQIPWLSLWKRVVIRGEKAEVNTDNWNGLERIR